MHRPIEAGAWNRFGVIVRVRAKTVAMAHSRFKGIYVQAEQGPRFRMSPCSESTLFSDYWQ